MAAEPTALLDLVSALIGDQGQKAAFSRDPGGWLAEHGHGDLDPGELVLAVDLAADNLPARVAAGLVDLEAPTGLGAGDALAHTLGQVAALDPVALPELDLSSVDDPWIDELPAGSEAGWEHLLGDDDGDPTDLLGGHDVSDLDDLGGDEVDDFDVYEPPGAAPLVEPASPEGADSAFADVHADPGVDPADGLVDGLDEPVEFGAGHEGSELGEGLPLDVPLDGVPEGGLAPEWDGLDGDDLGPVPAADLPDLDLDQVDGFDDGHETMVPEPDEAPEIDEDEFDETDFDEGPDVGLDLDLG